MEDTLTESQDSTKLGFAKPTALLGKVDVPAGGVSADLYQSVATAPGAKKVMMPGIGHTTVFPRVDNAYRGKESLAFDEA